MQYHPPPDIAVFLRRFIHESRNVTNDEIKCIENQIKKIKILLKISELEKCSQINIYHDALEDIMPHQTQHLRSGDTGVNPF
ncbi:hypothetical protein CEXT_593881 [Caerostris extrusa]|uniref:Uncharacterized protein n=1 Tax=Caerostris extrusa TaxID=172846 RepID=A0AAV4WCL6_CAEEX|nr:hypothetical protein CEXT_593881 [Caerostris extrusa]